MTDSMEMVASRGRQALARGPALLEEDPDEDECRAFGFLRGIRDRSLCLELRFLNGDRQLFPYSWLGPVKYNPSVGILLKFVGDLIYLVLIQGSNLNSMVKNGMTLFDRGLHRQRVIWIREMSEREVQRADEGETLIDHIRVFSYRADEEPKGHEWLAEFDEHAWT